MGFVKLAPYMKERTKGGSCNTCTGVIEEFKISGKKTTFACRKYDFEEMEQEMMMMSNEMDVVSTGLVEVKSIGVDGREFVWKNPIKIKLRSKGTGSYGKRECASDYDSFEYSDYSKVGDVHLVHFDNKVCPKNWFGLETLQDMITIDGDYAASQNSDNAYTDALILASRQAKTKELQKTDVIGIFGGSDEDTAHYDGILAQMFWAYGNAYFHSICFDLADTTGLQDGEVLTVKVGGKTFVVTWDSTIPTDETLSIPSYETLEEVAAAVTEWINSLTTVGGKKKLDAVYVGTQIIVTQKETGKFVRVRMATGDNPIKKWAECHTELQHSLIQNPMPVDDRPYLTTWRSDQYTDKNIWCELPDDIFRLLRDMPKEQQYNLYIDQYLYDRYTDNLGKHPDDNGTNRIATKFGDRIFFLKGLTEDETGIFLIAPTNNAYHFINADGSDLIARMIDDCEEMKFKFRTLNGVMVKKFPWMGANLLCSPFAANLVEPQPECETKIPCLMKECKRNFISTQGECEINAGFELSEVSRNEAVYALNGEIFEVEYIAGEAQPLPVGAVSVYVVQIINKTTGIPFNLLGTETYEYTLIANDGSEWTSTASDPLLQFTGLDNLVFTIQQTVSVVDENGRTCSDSLTRSEDESGEFALVGNCGDLSPEFRYLIEGDCVEGAVQFTATIQDDTILNNPVFDEFTEFIVTITGSVSGSVDVYTELPKGEVLTSTEPTDTFTVIVSAKTAAGCNYEDIVVDGDLVELTDITSC